MIYVRGTSDYHSGEWAHLFSIQHDDEGRDLWVVEFPNGTKDLWASWDATAGYDVRVQIEHPGVPDDSGNTSSAGTRAAAKALLASL